MTKKPKRKLEALSNDLFGVEAVKLSGIAGGNKWVAGNTTQRTLLVNGGNDYMADRD